ncbi:putative family 17 glucosidase SCW11 [Nakaseomyces bracarensis]|uniref:Family 17 glucosidase SCW11 n=1 Tax=Nakaseomyces bracarensis TaxID=273131 RepID=A0ABR4NTA1_9SACH
MLSLIQSFLFALFLVQVNGIPLFYKREIVTRMHTASTTNTVTDFYSTTTEVVLAPTVQFIISGDATFTTTLVPEGGDPNVQPTTTITSVIQVKRVLPTAAPSEDSNTQNVDTTTTSSPADAAADTQVTTTNPTDTPAPTTTLSPTTSKTSSIIFASEVVGIENVEANQSEQQQNEQQHVHKAGQVSTPVVDIQTTYTSTPATTTNDAQTTQTTDSSSDSTSTGAITLIPNAMAYSPYNNDGSCKTAEQVLPDLQLLKSKGINQIRMYGTDCNSLQTVLPQAKSLGISVNQGLWITSAGVNSIDIPVQQLISYGQTNGWDVFAYITIGNEAVISNYCSVSDLISKIGSVKSQLQAAGYTGQLTTSEPPVTFEEHPELCTSSGIDFVGINPHAYFDVNSNAESAGSFVKGQIELIQQVCGTGNVVVTETGYPSAGIQNGGNIPSKANQLLAIQKILEATNQQVTLLACFDDYWKAPGPYGIEQHFGILDNLP